MYARYLKRAAFLRKKWSVLIKIMKRQQGEKTSLLATNITETKKFQIETPDIVIKVNPERADLIETRVIDGRQCLVIAVDDHIEVNGVNVRTLKRKKKHRRRGIK